MANSSSRRRAAELVGRVESKAHSRGDGKPVADRSQGASDFRSDGAFLLILRWIALISRCICSQFLADLGRIFNPDDLENGCGDSVGYRSLTRTA